MVDNSSHTTSQEGGAITTMRRDVAGIIVTLDLAVVGLAKMPAHMPMLPQGRRHKRWKLVGEA
jgi:hypothetical protein